MATVNNPRFGNTGTPGQQNAGGHQQHGDQGKQGGGQEAGSGIMESVREGAESIASSVSSAAGQAWDTTRDGAQQVAQYAESAWDSTNDFMRRYPLVTLGIGICMGVSLTLALQPRRP
jgi:ElaB/YqjD/DUF883 family membrane-anchored ribosome-binding protein